MRRGQITLFIIAGIVLLLGVILAVAVFKEELHFRPPEELVISEVPTELKPLGFAIEQCQQKLADEAIRKALTHGGYIDPPTAGIIPIIPPVGNAMDVGGQPVAYWSYIQDGLYQSRKPSLHGVTSDALSQQVSEYVDDRLMDCVPWEEFSQYEIIRNVPISSVTFQDTTTRIVTAWDIDVTTALGLTELQAFQAELDAPVGKLFTVGEELLRIWERNRMPEQRTLDWLAVYAVDTNKIPPLYGGLKNGYDSAPYSLYDARPELMEVLAMQADSMTVVGTQNFKHIRYEEDTPANDLYLSGMITLGSVDENTNVEMLYFPTLGLDWAVDGNPGVAIPEVTRAPGPAAVFMPPTVDKSFSHSITYPLLVTVAENGYELRFGYEVNIHNNKPAIADIQEQLGIDAFCTAPGGSTLELTLEPAEVEAIATYSCGQTTCGLGEVVDGRLETTLPTCANGILEVNAPEYFSAPYSLSSAADQDVARVRMALHKPRPVTVTVKAREVIKTAPDTFQIGVNAQVATARVIMIRQDTPSVAIPDEFGYTELVPGTYDVYVYGSTEFPEDDPYIIPAEERCYDAGMLSVVIDDECVDLPQLNFTTIPTVYAEYTGENGVVIPEVIDELTITGASINPYSMYHVEDVGIIGGLFEKAAELRAEDNVEYS